MQKSILSCFFLPVLKTLLPKMNKKMVYIFKEETLTQIGWIRYNR